jgi:hypothetical protein
VRKLFVNCCRVRPDRCLELLCAVMSSQPLPLSQGKRSSCQALLLMLLHFCGAAELFALRCMLCQLFAAASLVSTLRW